MLLAEGIFIGIVIFDKYFGSPEEEVESVIVFYPEEDFIDFEIDDEEDEDNTLSFPEDIWVDSRFDDEEFEDILWAVEEWERTTEMNLFFYKGRHIDPEFSEDDRSDGKNVIYKVEASTKVTKRYEEINHKRTKRRDVLGWGMRKSDTLILAYRFYKVYSESSRSVEARQYYFKRLVLHELGHFLGLPDVDDAEVIMYRIIDKNFEEPLALTKNDLKAFRRAIEKGR